MPDVKKYGTYIPRGQDWGDCLLTDATMPTSDVYGERRDHWIRWGLRDDIKPGRLQREWEERQERS